MVETRSKIRKSVAQAPEMQERVDDNVSPEEAEAAAWAAHYRHAAAQEKEAENRTVLRRLVKRIKLLWFQLGISLGPFMLDPWEQTLYFLTSFAMCGLVVSAFVHGPLVPWAAARWDAAAVVGRESWAALQRLRRPE